MKKIILFIALLMNISGTSQAQNNVAKMKYEEAEQAYNNREYDEALQKLDEAESLLGSSNPKTQYLRIVASFQKLTQYYVRPNYTFQNPIDVDHIISLKKNANEYVTKYGNTAGIEEKFAEVYKIHEKMNFYKLDIDAAKSGNTDAMVKLAHAYLMEKYAYQREDDAKSFYWYKQAAEKGNGTALRMIAYRYLDGDASNGITQDPAKGIELLKKSVVAGDVQALKALSDVYRDGKGVPKDEALQNKYFQEFMAALPGCRDARTLYWVGYWYHWGNEGLEKDIEKAKEFYTKAAELDMNYYKDLAFLSPRNVEGFNTATKYLKKAADGGSVEAMLSLASYYKMAKYNSGNALEDDYAKAIEWYMKAIEWGNTTAMSDIAHLYSWISPYQDKAKAREYAALAAKKGSEDAKKLLKGME